MRYVTAEEMKRIEREAIEKRGVTARELMERAGRALAEETKKVVRTGDIVVFCGYGNNGGDGLAAARCLMGGKYNVAVYLVGSNKTFSPDTEDNYYALTGMGMAVKNIGERDNLAEIFTSIGRPSAVIDAVFGVGLYGELDFFYTDLIDRINGLSVPVISADVPSGLDSDTGHPLPMAVEALKTVTFGYPKKGFQNPAARTYLGEVIVADIGLGSEK